MSIALWETGFATEDGEAICGAQESATRIGCSDSTPAPKWFAAYTATHHEKHVHQALADRQVESFLPLYSTRRQWKKRLPETVHLPLFPNYVFVRISRRERTAVLGTPGVFSIVGSAREPWPVPDPDIEAIRLGLQTRKIEPHSYLTVGERVRIRAGVMTGVEGILVRKKNDFRVVLSLDAIMRSVAVEVDADDIEPASTFAKLHAIPWAAQAERETPPARARLGRSPYVSVGLVHH